MVWLWALVAAQLVVGYFLARHLWQRNKDAEELSFVFFFPLKNFAATFKY